MSLSALLFLFGFFGGELLDIAKSIAKWVERKLNGV